MMVSLVFGLLLRELSSLSNSAKAFRYSWLAKSCRPNFHILSPLRSSSCARRDAASTFFCRTDRRWDGDNGGDGADGKSGRRRGDNDRGDDGGLDSDLLLFSISWILA